MRRIALLDAPSNLGLRPPTPTSTPGCAKAPGALRDQGLLARLAARDAGCLTPPRYDPGDWRPGDGVCHADAIAAYSVALAGRIGAIIDADEFPVVLGGDCSILLGSALAMHRLGEAVGGRIGLVFVDGHSDFRHPGNASYVGAAAGEDLALATGRGQADLAAIEGRRPYFRDIDVVVLGIRAQDEYRLDLQAAGIVTRAVPALRAEGAARTAQWARDQLADCAGYWVHVDVDVLDPAVLPAVDAPDPGGIAFPELELLIAGLVDTPHCLGIELTVFDPDYDPDGTYAAEIVSAVVAGLAPIRAAASARGRSPLAFTPRRRPAPDGDRFRPPAIPEPPSRPVAAAETTSVWDSVPTDEPAAAWEPVPPTEAVPAWEPVPPSPGWQPEAESAADAWEPAVESTVDAWQAAAEADGPSPEPAAPDAEPSAAAEPAAGPEPTVGEAEPAKKPAIGRQRRSAFDALTDDTANNHKRRSAAEILAAPLGGDATGPGRLRRSPSGDATAPGRLRRSADDDVVPPSGRLRRAADDDVVLPSGRLRRAADDDVVLPSGRLRRAADDDVVPPSGRLRRAADDDVAPPSGRLRRAADDDVTPPSGRLRRATDDEAGAPGEPRRASDDDASAPGRLRRTTDDDATGPGRLRRADEGDAITTDVRPGGLRRPTTPPDDAAAVDEA